MTSPGITRFSLVCLRFDDYHQEIDHERWIDVLSRYDDRGLRGVIGVIPKYKGDPLDADAVDFLHDLRDNGWELAQHGYTHDNIGEGRGGHLYDDRSEFRGVPLDEQRHRIGSGYDILKSHGIEPTTFIPPWHEYDQNTVRGLTDVGFNCINEGRWPIPRTIGKITLVPTHIPAMTPYILGFGIVTLVSHPHLDDDPMRNADAVLGYEDHLRTPSEVVSWWRKRSTCGVFSDALKP